MVDRAAGAWRKAQTESAWAEKIVAVVRASGAPPSLSVVCSRGCTVGRFWTMPDGRVAVHLPGVRMSAGMFSEVISSPTGRRPVRDQYRILDGVHAWGRINNPFPDITTAAVPAGAVIFECRHAQREPLTWTDPETGLMSGGKITLDTR